MRKLLLISTSVFWALQLSVASTYYVATNGVNTHAGSSAAPWKTVVYGSSKLKDGDTLRIKPGTYIETEMVEIPENNISVLADDPINRPTIDFNDKMNYYTRYVEAYGRSNFSWDGVNIKNAGGSERGAINLGFWYSSNTGTRATGITIKNCDITYAYNAAIRWMHCDNILIENVYTFQCAQLNADRKNTYNHPHILLGYWSNNVIQRNCRVIQNHGEGIGPYVGCTNWIIENCEVADNYKINVYVDSEVGSCIVRNNLLYNTGYYVIGGTTNQQPSGVRVANEVSDFVGWGGISDPSKYLVQNVDIYNNIILNCNTGIEIFPYNNGPFQLTNSTISNNTIVGTVDNTSGIYITAPGAKEIRNNIVYNTYGITLNQHAVFSNNYIVNPLFVNGTGFVAENYKLAENSPCINVGTTIAKITTDYEGNLRPTGSAYELGAYEFTAPAALENPFRKLPNEIIFTQNFTDHKVSIRLNSWPQSKNTHISIVDLTGRSIVDKTFFAVDTFELSTDNIPAGMYVLYVKNGKQTSAKKIIIK
jgi:hypothetical protein